MGIFFSDAVERANRLIYAGRRREDFAEGFNLLQAAVAEGDADAKHFLSRCYYGKSCVYWEYAGLPDDRREGRKLLRASAREGSAVGVLGALRMGELEPSVIDKMPFASAREAFDIVLDMAERGEPFCQFMVGNVYIWGDAFRIDGLEAADADRPESVRKCVPWYEKSIAGGLHWCGNNLLGLYEGGSSGIEAEPEKLNDLLRRLASMGNPQCEYFLGNDLYCDEDYEGAFPLLLSAAEKGHTPAFNFVGLMYFEGKGIETDYARAFYWLTQAMRQGTELAAATLALCYFHGRGAARDYEKARALLEGILQKGETALTGEALCVLGEMCTDGLGGPRDAARAAAYLKEAAEKGSEEARIRLAQRRRGGPSAQAKRWPWIVAGAFALLNVFMTVLSVLDNAYVFAAITGVAAVLCFGVAVFLPRGARTALLCVLITLVAFFGTFALYEYFGW